MDPGYPTALLLDRRQPVVSLTSDERTRFALPTVQGIGKPAQPADRMVPARVDLNGN